jgi:hypothetical protein
VVEPGELDDLEIGVVAGLERAPDRGEVRRRRCDREVARWDLVANLLAQAEGTLRGITHRQRIAQLHRLFPGHAAQLERLRRHAAERLGRLRARVDFVCQGGGTVPAVAEPVQAMRSSLLQ